MRYFIDMDAKCLEGPAHLSLPEQEPGRRAGKGQSWTGSDPQLKTCPPPANRAQHCRAKLNRTPNGSPPRSEPLSQAVDCEGAQEQRDGRDGP